MTTGTGWDSAHIVVVGNEKGGCGKSTIAMHLVTHLLLAGQRVAAIDLDSRQRSLTRYIENRARWARRQRVALPLPTYFAIDRATDDNARVNEEREFTAFAEAIGRTESVVDFIVIDTPATDTYLNRLAHSMADTLVTPVNDSFIDLDVLVSIDPASFEIVRESHYAQLVRDARRKRRMVDERLIDWVIVRNRLSSLDSRNQRSVNSGLEQAAEALQCRIADGIGERTIYREFFPIGLTALDPLEEDSLGSRPGFAHLAARHEIRRLIEALKLPIDERGRRRALARRTWAETQARPIDLDDVVAAE